MKSFILLLLSIIFAVINNSFSHNLGKKELENKAIWFLNSIIALLSVVLLTILEGGFSIPSKHSIVWGVIYGVAMAVFLIAKMTALAYGPIAITSLIGCCALVIPTLFGIFYCKEKATALQLLGFVILLFSLILCNNFSDSEKKPKKQWYFWCALFFIASGCVSVVFQMHQNSDGKAEINQMMIIGYTVSTVLLGVASIAGSNPKATLKQVLKKDVIIFALLCGIPSLAYNRLNLYLTGVIANVIFFPVFNGSVILSATLLGSFFYKEKLCLKQKTGTLLGVVSIFLIANII